MSERAPRILLVEDRDDVAAMYNLAFDLEGFETRVASNGTEGLELAASGWPQLAVLDIQLPDIDGLALFDEMRTRNIAIPVIFLTVRYDEAMMRQAKAHGAVEFLFKPQVKPSDLVERIRHHLSNGA